MFSHFDDLGLSQHITSTLLETHTSLSIVYCRKQVEWLSLLDARYCNHKFNSRIYTRGFKSPKGA